ncbi:MAG TPA: hypothetical protein PKE06_27765, partial [Flavilitoribacter sp.]|nr:hypothetical protein [Flavilitoribacter sp.]
RHVLPVMETDPSAAGVKQRGFPKWTAATFTFRIFLLHFAFDGQASQEATGRCRLTPKQKKPLVLKTNGLYKLE